MEQPRKKRLEKVTEKISAGEAPEKEHKQGKDRAAEPTRYGDWEVSGRCVDF